MIPVPGERYLCGLPPYGTRTIVYLGQAWWLPKSYCRVRDFITGRVLFVKLDVLKPLLVSLGGNKQ